MQYLYNEDAKEPVLTVEGDDYRYLFKVRRAKLGDIIPFRNLKDDKIYKYKIIFIDRKSAVVELFDEEDREVDIKRELTLGWCIIEPKSIERALPSLNEIGVSKIVFIKCAYTQANYKVKRDKLLKILINSNQQSGRSSLMKIEFSNSIFDFLLKYPDSYLLNFSKNSIDEAKEDIKSIVIGCEGGFSEDEIKLFKEDKIVGFNSPIILRSYTASMLTASKILL